jgi:enoyl-CoA hydratase
VTSSTGADLAGVAVERQGPTTILTLSRPERLNALSHAMIRRLDGLLDDLMYDYRQRVLVITGSGPAFCAGMDLKGQADGATWVEGVGSTQSSYALQEAVGRLIAKLRDVPQPVIAAVNGVAAGGGMSLALAADVRIGEPATRFIPSFVRLGVSGGDMGSSWFLPRVVGWDRAAEILLTGREVRADESERIGLVSRLVPEGTAVAEAGTMAEQICERAPFSTRATKGLLNLSRDGMSLRQQIEMENRTQVMMTTTDDFAEGAEGFVERRPPVFRDR